MSKPVLSVVIIGRDEGERLVRAIEAVRRAERPPGEVELLYVDSGSLDGSLERAAALGLTTLTTGDAPPNPGLARDLGWRASQGDKVLFVDGDSAVEPDFIINAWPLFDDPRIAVATGGISEADPGGSLYNRVLSLEWRVVPSGPLQHCGGNFLIRRSALETVDGFRHDMPGGEDAELCARIREQGWLIWCLPQIVARHDLAIHSFGQYARRAFRRGYSLAATRELKMPRRLQAERNIWAVGGATWLFSLAAPVATYLYGATAAAWSAAIVGAAVGPVAYRFRSRSSNPVTLLLFGFHFYMVRAIGLLGQTTCGADRFLGRRRGFIHYKRASESNTLRCGRC